MQITPCPGAGLGTGDEQQVGVFGVDEKWIDIADAEITRCHALPTGAAVAANTEAGYGFRPAIGRRRRAIELAWIIGWNQHAVRIGIDIIQRRPSLAAIRAAQKAADFDRDVDNVGIARMKSDAFCMRLMRRTGECPLLDARHLPQAR